MAFCSALQTKADHFRRTEKYCDVKIRVQDRYFSCHRVVLASASEYFDALFGGGFMEKDVPETVLHGIEVETFEEILQCVYNVHEHRCNISASNVLDLLSACLYLGIQPLETECVNYILENLSSIRHLARILSLAHSMNIMELINTVNEYLVRNFQLFYDDDELLEFSYEDVSSLLSRWFCEDYPCKYETLIVHFLIRWIRRAPNERKKYFTKLMESVDFNKISPNYVALFTQHFHKFISVPDCEIPVLEKSSNQGRNSNGGSKDALSLKRILSEYFNGTGTLSADCDVDMPTSFHDSTFYSDVLGLHVYLEYYFRKDDGFEMYQDANVLSFNKYYPNWFLSCKTNAWYGCDDRRTVLQESTNQLYCMELHNDEPNSAIHRQTFCTYSSLDMKLASKVLASPPIYLVPYRINMCSTPQGNIYLLDSQPLLTTSRLTGSGTFSAKEIREGFYWYNCELDKWFPAPPSKYKQVDPCLSVDYNLIYSIGGKYKIYYERSHFAQAFDYRSGKWMRLPKCNPKKYYCCDNSESCIVKGELFVGNEDQLESFDTVAGKWRKIDFPMKETVSIKRMFSYDDHLWILFLSSDADQSRDYRIATSINPKSRTWTISSSLCDTIVSLNPNKCGCYCDVRDLITFKV